MPLVIHCCLLVFLLVAVLSEDKDPRRIYHRSGHGEIEQKCVAK